MPHPAPLAAGALTGSPGDFTRGCRADVARARAAAERLAARAGGRDGLAALAAYDEVFGVLAEAGARASLGRNVHPDPALRDAAEACEREVDAATTELSVDPRLYAALREVDGAGFDPASQHLLAKALRDFRRAGVDRDEATRARVRALRDELTRIGQEFGRNIKDDVRTLALPAAALEGLPDDRRAHPAPMRQVALHALDNPDYVPFITYARSSQAREALWRLYRLRGHPKTPESTSAHNCRSRPRWAGLPRLAIELGRHVSEEQDDRQQRGGGGTHTREPLPQPADGARLNKASARKREDDPAAERVQPWDSAWLQERVKAEQYGFDAREVRPYFEYRRVKEGVLALAGRLFGVELVPVHGAALWHSDVEAYDVLEQGRSLGRVYLDMHPRDGKYKHYAQFTLAAGVQGQRLPEGVLVCNFPRPGAEPALLEHGEVRTFLHELGHLMHHVLGGHTRWATQSGVATEWDFVEAPSQMLEEWVWDPEALAGFARHVESGAPIPAELVARMRAADEYGKGLWVRQQMFYAALSLELHRRDPAGLDTTAVVAELQERYTPFRHVPGTAFQASFGHLDGYSAIYYTYMWSLVIAKDLFSVFRREGVLSRAPAERYRRAVLEPGGSRPAAELVEAFLGRPFTFDAFTEWLDAA